MVASLFEIRSTWYLGFFGRAKEVPGLFSENETWCRDLDFQESSIFPQTTWRKHQMEKWLLLSSLLCTMKEKSRTVLHRFFSLCFQGSGSLMILKLGFLVGDKENFRRTSGTFMCRRSLRKWWNMRVNKEIDDDDDDEHKKRRKKPTTKRYDIWWYQEPWYFWLVIVSWIIFHIVPLRT